MSNLEEIEAAVTSLAASEKLELLVFVAGQLRAEGSPLPEPRLYSAEELEGWMNEDEEDMRRFRAGD